MLYAIRGYAAVYYDGTPQTEFELWPGEGMHKRAVERIMPTAFTKDLVDRRDVAGLFNHDPSKLLGRRSAGTMFITSDARGLAYSIAPDETSAFRDALAYVTKRNVTGSSFGFSVRAEKWDSEPDKDVRTLTDVQLYDVGPVTFPAYGKTTAEAQPIEEIAHERARYRNRRMAEIERELQTERTNMSTSQPLIERSGPRAGQRDEIIAEARLKLFRRKHFLERSRDPGGALELRSLEKQLAILSHQR